MMKCNSCNIETPISEIVKNRTVCKKCNNEKRRNKYATNDELRKKLIETATVFKQKRLSERNTIKQDKLEELLEAAKSLLEWVPVCSIGSSGYNRQEALKKAIARFE